MPTPVTCPACRTAYRLPDRVAADRPVRVRCARCRHVFEIGVGSSIGRAKPDHPPGARPAGPATAQRPLEAPRVGRAGEYELGSLPGDLAARPDPKFGEAGPPPDDPSAGWLLGPAADRGSETVREAPARPARNGSARGAGQPAGEPAPAADRPFRRATPPAAAGRRAFLTGLLGVSALAATGLAAVRAWRGRDWASFLAGDPYPIRIRARRSLTGRAGGLFVIDGSVENLSGEPKGFFEVRGRLLDADGRTLAERQVYAGQVLGDAELRGLSRAELERRFAETVFGERMANARVEPRQAVPFQIVFLSPPAASRVARSVVEVVAARAVP